MSDERRHTQDEILARLDERTVYLVSEIAEIKRRLADSYVTQDEFKPIRLLIYGLVGLILTSVAGAGITFLIKK